VASTLPYCQRATRAGTVSVAHTASGVAMIVMLEVEVRMAVDCRSATIGKKVRAEAHTNRQ
jgi:hypothetical protein